MIDSSIDSGDWFIDVCTSKKKKSEKEKSCCTAGIFVYICNLGQFRVCFITCMHCVCLACKYLYCAPDKYKLALPEARLFIRLKRPFCNLLLDCFLQILLSFGLRSSSLLPCETYSLILSKYFIYNTNTWIQFISVPVVYYAHCRMLNNIVTVCCMSSSKRVWHCISCHNTSTCSFTEQRHG